MPAARGSLRREDNVESITDDRAATEPQTLTAVAPVVARVRSMSADYLEEWVGPR